MTIVDFIFDWNSFWINIIAGFIFFILSILLSIWLIPKYTVRLIKGKNKKFLINKISAVLQELCEFLSLAPYRDKILNYELIAIYTKKSDIKNFRFVALCCVNVFSRLIYPQLILVIYDFYKGLKPNDSYKLISEEFNRLKNFRLEIERILAVHSLHIDDTIIHKISDLCLEIKAFETSYKVNLDYDELLEKTNTEREGIMGLNDLPKIYTNLLHLIKDLITLDYFEYKIEVAKS
jgi:hypothetical protein